MRRALVASLFTLALCSCVKTVAPPAWHPPETFIELSSQPRSGLGIYFPFGNGGTTRTVYFSNATAFRFVAVHYLHTWGDEEHREYKDELGRPCTPTNPSCPEVWSAK